MRLPGGFSRYWQAETGKELSFKQILSYKVESIRYVMNIIFIYVDE